MTMPYSLWRDHPEAFVMSQMHFRAMLFFGAAFSSGANRNLMEGAIVQKVLSAVCMRSKVLLMGKSL